MNQRILEGKVAFVTGGTRGIGRAVAARLCAAGAKVALTGRDPTRTAAIAAELGASSAGSVRGYHLDVRDRGAVDDVFQRAARELGGLHFLVNNAGVAGHTPLSTDDDTLWHEIIDTNLTGVWHCTRAATRHMGEDARVVHVSSVLGKLGVPAYSAYCASKHGVIGMARSQAVELAGRGIRVNAICPGWVDTEMARGSMERNAKSLGVSYETFRAQALLAVPQQRMMAPEEIAELVLFLCGPGAAGITGQAISIDGGQAAF